MTESTDYASFRQRLDAVLRTRDARQVHAFMIEEDQWTREQPEDPEYAMWLMIAGTPTLTHLHAEARRWLTDHGHTEAVEAVLSRDQKSRQGKPGGQPGRSKGGQPGAQAGRPARAAAPKARPGDQQRPGPKPPR